MEKLLDQIRTERKRQTDKWGIQTHSPFVWLLILMEEVGEIAIALDEGDMDQADREANEVAAVALAFRESLAAVRGGAQEQTGYHIPDEILEMFGAQVNHLGRVAKNLLEENPTDYLDAQMDLMEVTEAMIE